MSDFVNFNKRDINLPPGCKDLFDLLQPVSQRKKPGFPDRNELRKIPGWIRKVKQGPFIQTREGFSDIGKYVGMVLRSTATVSFLFVSSSDGRMVFHLDNQQFKGTKISASVNVEIGTTQEQLLRQFFERHCLELSAESGMPSSFIPNLPVYTRWKMQPLSPESGALIRLMTDLFRETCGLLDSDKVEITFQERTYPPEALKYFGGQD